MAVTRGTHDRAEAAVCTRAGNITTMSLINPTDATESVTHTFIATLNMTLTSDVVQDLLRSAKQVRLTT